MTWVVLLLGLVVGVTIGAVGMAVCAAGAHSELASEIWELRAQLRSEPPSGDGA